MAKAPTPSRLQFGPFLADFRACELRKDGRKIRLQEKPMLLLGALTASPGEVVSREELQKQLWPDDTFVDFETGLNSAVRKLREALADNPENPRYIETIPKHGYRFLAQVHSEATNEPLSREQPSPRTELTSTSLGRRTIASLVETVSEYRRAKRFWMSIAVVLALSGLVLMLVQRNVLKVAGLHERVFGASGAAAIHSIAVLPLQNLSTDPAQEYFSDGMTDALITDLAQIGSVKVISRTSSMQYKQTKKSLPEIARELNVDGIVEGTVQRSGDRVRITAQFIHGPSDTHLWANSYERDLRDIFTLEREVAGDIANQLRTRPMLPKQAPRSQPRLVEPEVLDAYVQGTYYLNGRGRGGGDEQEKKAQSYFQHAIALDPNFAPAYVGLAQAYTNLSRNEPEDLVLMRRAAEEAVELDPSSSDALRMLGDVKAQAWDWHGAEQEYRNALALNPNNASAHDFLGEVLDELDRLEEGWKEFQIAQELDPNQDHLADALYRRSQFDRAIEIRQKIALRDPGLGYNHYALAMNFAQKRMYKEFVVEMGKAASLFGMPEVAGHLQHAYDQSGGQGALRQWARELEHFAASGQVYLPGNLAGVYAALGDRDHSFYWLEEYRQHHERASAEPFACFKSNPWFAPIRSDPRFSDFLRRVGLPP
jgi:TolB-like protein/DNA-binding winged helix-turn-helix (wHTH) protein